MVSSAEVVIFYIWKQDTQHRTVWF